MLEKLAQEIEEAFRKVKPYWMPPHPTVYAAAKNYGLTATIDGHDEATWKECWKEWFEEGELDDPFLVRLSNGDELIVDWPDERTIKVKIPGRRKKSVSALVKVKKDLAKL